MDGMVKRRRRRDGGGDECCEGILKYQRTRYFVIIGVPKGSLRMAV